MNICDMRTARISRLTEPTTATDLAGTQLRLYKCTHACLLKINARIIWLSSPETGTNLKRYFNLHHSTGALTPHDHLLMHTS